MLHTVYKERVIYFLISVFMKAFITIVIFSLLISIPSSTWAASAGGIGKPKVVYLTFDADMTPSMKKRLHEGKVSAWYSKDLVSYLETEKVPATIFVTGMFAEIYPNIIKEMATHPTIEIANHTYDHSVFEGPCYGLKVIKTDTEKIQEMQRTQDILTALIGHTPTFFRHPGLCHNAHDDGLAKKVGLTVSDGDLVSGDAFNTSSKSVIKAVVRNVHDGSVIIMHLGGPNAPATDVAVKALVTKLRAEHYTFAIL